jgi:hypothetical protein
LNKRLIKKMMKKKQQFNGFIFAEGNNGGDFIQLENLEDGMVHLRVGSCCVPLIEKAVPVEFLTGIIQNAMFEHNGNIDEIIDSFGWNQSYKDALKKKVRKVK